MLEKLSEVQSRDLDLLQLAEEKAKTPPELIRMQALKEKLEGSLGATRQNYDALRKQIQGNELELQSLEARRKAAADAAIQAGNSREATQYQNQELQFATRIQELEDDTLPLLERQEALEAEVKQLEEQLGELEPELQAVIDTETARVSALDDQIASIAGERDALARGVEAPLLKQYEQVRRAKRGLGLVRIVANQHCGGCNMRLPIHVVQKARAGKGVTRCPSCGRILWADDSHDEG
ncbi:MAG TPA: C4-type zinc ribbon domain-containing protein [Trueperaceae bacterium]